MDVNKTWVLVNTTTEKSMPLFFCVYDSKTRFFQSRNLVHVIGNYGFGSLDIDTVHARYETVLPVSFMLGERYEHAPL